MNKLSESKRKANKKWDDKNKERKNYINKRSTARNFIKNMDHEDIAEFEQLIQERKERKDWWGKYREKAFRYLLISIIFPIFSFRLKIPSNMLEIVWNIRFLVWVNFYYLSIIEE